MADTQLTVQDYAVLNTIVATLQNLVIATNNLNQTMKTVLPVVQSVSATATDGGGAVLPGHVFEYLVATDPSGNSVKIPCYKP